MDEMFVLMDIEKGHDWITASELCAFHLVHLVPLTAQGFVGGG